MPAVEPVRLVPLCASCAHTPTLADTFTVRSVTGSVSLDGQAVLERLRTGQLSGQDWIVGDGPPVLVAAHPAFAPAFARGEVGVPAPAPPPVVAPAPKPAAERPLPPRRRGPGIAWGSWALRLIVLGAVGAAGWQAWLHQDELRQAALDASRVVAPDPVGSGGTTKVANELPPEPAGPDPLVALAAEVGPVEEPLAALEAQAVEAWQGGTPEATARAAGIARRAVARAPADADTLALYAVLAAEAGDAAPAAHEAAKRAIVLGKGGVASELGRAAVAIAAGDDKSVAAELTGCLAAGDRVCRFLAAAHQADPARAIAELDTLAAEWPEHRAPARRAAELAARLDAPDAAARLDALRDPDAAQIVARGLLHARDGEGARVVALARKLGTDAPPELRVAAARVLLTTGRPADVVAMLAPIVGADAPADTLPDALLLHAQARWLEAWDDAARLDVAGAAVARLVEVGRSDPAVAQVRALVAHARGDRAEASRAWTVMDTSRRQGPELARALRTQVALLVDSNVAGSEALPVAEAARAADPSDPLGHVWVVSVHLIGHSPAKAIEALRTAIQQVDGQVSRRRVDLAVLDTGAPARKLLGDVEAALGNNATYATTLPMARAASAWLAGDTAAASGILAAYPGIEADADALALRARLRSAAGDHAGALADWERVIAARPKEPAYLAGGLQAMVEARRLAKAPALAAQVLSSRVTGPLRWSALAEVDVAAGNPAAAIEKLEACLALDPLDVKARARLRALRRGER